MAVSPRTRTLLAWLPATVLVLIIGGVVLASLAIQGSWWTEERPAASEDQKAPDGSSMLTDAGFDYVNVEGVVRVRVGEGGLSATELGLPADGEKSAEFRRPVRAIVAAGDQVYALDDIAGLSVTSRDDRLATVTLRPDVVRGWVGAVGYLRALSAEFGWDAAQLDGLEEEVADFNRSGEGETFTATIGPSAGGAAIVTGTLVFDRASGATPVTITFEPATD
ncbi:hypothetical protein K0817_013635 [Microbacterium sp. HD4P20]|uniref:hypothetical protein n=1 Tax=Microbacterium sp. HD4P20 TaxID=2864874 RepID=UPI001C63D98B|nr:hypothetical protein [Microbacterium sp. HD4P20]MCP2637595.1 hypothetical protein [Microbacterium sp. HD4P20]